MSDRDDTKELPDQKRIDREISDYIKLHLNELYRLLLRLAQIPAPEGKEEQRAAFCRDWLAAQGAEDVYIDGAGNVIWPYRARGRRLIVFDAHMDVVFPDLEPLPLYEAEGRIFCPGVGDDSANVAVLMMAAKYVAEYRPDTGEYGLLFVCGVGEEGLGNLKGSREICREFGSRIEAFYAFDLTMERYTARAVGSLRYRVQMTAQGGHSYSCFGNSNANVLLAELILALYQIQVPRRGKTTYNVGMISGGTSVNTISQRAELLYEVRSDDAEDLAEMEQKFMDTVESFQQRLGQAGSKEAKDISGTVSVTLIGSRPCESGVDEKKRRSLFAYVEQAVEQVRGIRPVPVPCSTDCNIPLSMGIPSVCIGTCLGAGAHTREEYIEKDSLSMGFEIALLLIRNYIAVHPCCCGSR